MITISWNYFLKCCGRSYVEAGTTVQRKRDRSRDKNQQVVLGITGRKVRLMYQQREK
jgi:hypothetical protein